MSELPKGARPATADELRKAAESADGRRGRTLQLVYAVPKGQKPNTGTYVMYDYADEKDRKKYQGYDLYDVLGTCSEWTCSDHRRESETVVKIAPLDGNEQAFGPGEADALFWGESAVEKFVFPYYIRHLTKAQFDWLYDLYMGVRSRGPNQGPVMALSHLPTSDYGTGPGGDNGGGRIATLTPEQHQRFGRLFELGVIRADRPKPQSVPAYLIEMLGE